MQTAELMEKKMKKKFKIPLKLLWVHVSEKEEKKT